MRRISGSGFHDPLVIAAKAGDKIAYGRLVELYQSPVRGFLRHLTRHDFALADDLAQDTFIQAYQRLESFRQDSTFKSWVTSIAYKLFLQYIRKDKRRTALLIAASEMEEETADSNINDDKIDIDRALACLKFEERTAISLCHRQGLSHSEIALVMQIPLGSVKSHIARGRENLKTLLTSTKTRRPS